MLRDDLASYAISSFQIRSVQTLKSPMDKYGSETDMYISHCVKSNVMVSLLETRY